MMDTTFTSASWIPMAMSRVPEISSTAVAIVVSSSGIFLENNVLMFLTLKNCPGP